MLGPNGGGKTTLLRVMLGLIKPDSGVVRIFGKKPSEARGQIGYVPQFSTIRQDFPTTALDMTLMGAASLARTSLWGRQNLWSKGTAARQKAMNALSCVGIADLADHPIHALSGGQRQRLLLARALMGKTEGSPFLLLLDEPTSSIDPLGKGCFIEFLDTFRKEITMVLVSHELGMASPFFNQVALVNKTVSLAPGGCPDSVIFHTFIGDHAPDCPVGRLMRHAPDCACPESGQFHPDI
ncbi:cation ABC transporter ATP-binding protein [Deltaproteobacteria bacterium]|nr:cation ABC transporter ATP-binding protein [Deltaproteobacteria bacterium]